MDSSSVTEDEIDGLAVVRGAKLKGLFERWSEQHEAAGGDRNLTIAIGPTWVHAADVRYGGGAVQVDTVEGRVSAKVWGLDPATTWELWLIDTVAGDERDETTTQLVGTLEPSEKLATLDANLDPGLFATFQVDRVAVTRAGERPDESPYLGGSASLFQRLYSALKTEQTLLASDFTRYIKRVEPDSGGSILGVRSAIAAPIFVDSDTIFNGLVRNGSDLFFNETFDGNGRTCGTCHPADNNTTIDVAFIETLPDSDPLFVAEFVPALAQNFEKPALMRGAALILENVDGMDDLANKFVMRGVPHTLGMSVSLAPTTIPFDNTAPPNSNFPPGFPAQRTGWGGDGAPNSGSLRDFAVGAVNQHFPKTLARTNGSDFRFPTSSELDAMEAFQLALGRAQELNLDAISFKNPRATLGREIFNRTDTGNPQGTPCNGSGPGCPALPAGKCAICHNNAGANINSDFFSPILGVPVSGNANFATNVNGLRAPPAELIDPANNPRDGGFGIVPHDGTPLPQNNNNPCFPITGGFGVVTLPGGALPPGLCEEDFNIPSIVEAADSGPFFHNNAVDTIEAAVGFYNDAAFNTSVGAQLIAALDTNGTAISLDSTEVSAVATMLRTVNALDNLRAIRELCTGALSTSSTTRSKELTDVAIAEAEDGIEVLSGIKMHAGAMSALAEAIDNLRASQTASSFNRFALISEALTNVNTAEDDLIN